MLYRRDGINHMNRYFLPVYSGCYLSGQFCTYAHIYSFFLPGAAVNVFTLLFISFWLAGSVVILLFSLEKRKLAGDRQVLFKLLIIGGILIYASIQFVFCLG
jgi:hypothetical protein